MPNKSLTKNTNINKSGQGANNAFLIKPEEILVKKEESSVVVRTKEGKLVRRTDKGGLDDIINLIKPGEVFIRAEENAIIVRNEAGKLIKRRLAEPAVKIKKEPQKEQKSATKIGAINPALKVVRVNKEESLKQEEQPKSEPDKQSSNTSSLRERLKNRHAFLSRIEKGEKVTVDKEPAPMDEATFTPMNDFVEEIETDDVSVDSSVTELENAALEDKYNRTVGNMSSVATRGIGKGSISGSAINPNEKPVLGSGSKMSQSLAGNDSGYVLAKPEKDISFVKPKKEKKPKKPFNTTAFVLSLVGVYLVAILAYFFIGYNFKPKKVDVILYYITIGEDAKLKYYDGEKINTTDMHMTFYYSENDVKQASLTESNIAEPTVGMGYGIASNGYVNALWTGEYENKATREIKLKFDYDGLICYVPVTVYRNKLKALVKHFDVPSLSAGQEINPTIYGVYTNEVIAESGETKQRELSHNDYDLFLFYNGVNYNLKNNGAYKNGQYIMPETIGEIPIDYAQSGTKLIARYKADGFNAETSLVIYS